MFPYFLGALGIVVLVLTNYFCPDDQRGYFAIVITLFVLCFLAWALPLVMTAMR